MSVDSEPERTGTAERVEAAVAELLRLAARHPDEARGALERLADAVRPDPPPVPDLSVVLPVFNEEENVRELHRRLTESLGKAGLAAGYELVFVDDGSSDRSVALLAELGRDDRSVRLIRLSRNFGHQAAITAGIDHARGRAVALLDADLQDPPELLGDMLARWRDGADVVYAVRTKRKESWLKRTAYHTFYRTFRWLSNTAIPLDSGDFCLMDRRVVDELRRLGERNRFLRGLRSWVGFTQVAFPYERDARFGGEPKYTWRALVGLALDGILSFSAVPLRLATVLGMIVLTVGVVYLAYTLSFYFFVGVAPQGWTSLIVLLLLLGGGQLVLLGTIGEYIARIYDETKRRPNYVVMGGRG